MSDENLINDNSEEETLEDTMSVTSSASNILTSSVNSNLEMMEKIANDEQTLEDIKNLTSSKVTDQLKVYLISQARNELIRILKLTKFLDRLESSFINKVDQMMDSDDLTLKQYSDTISLIANLLNNANSIVSRVLGDDSLMTILNTTIYSTGNSNGSNMTTVVSVLKDSQSRERVRSVLTQVLSHVNSYDINVDAQEIPVENEGDENE